jgi:hypothetical protein
VRTIVPWLVRYVHVEQHHDLIGNDDREDQQMEPCVSALDRFEGEYSDSGGIREVHIERDELIESSRVKAGGSSQLPDHNDITCALWAAV